MKKILTLVLALALACSAICSASAVTLELVRESETKMDWLEGTDLLVIRPEGEYQTANIFNVNGEMVSDKLFFSSAIYGGRYGYGSVTEVKDTLNNSGLMDGQGRLVVPCEYGDVKIYRNWAVGVKLENWDGDDYDYREFMKDEIHYGITQADVYTLPEGQLVASLSREQYKDSEGQGMTINILDRAGVTTAYDRAMNPLGTLRAPYNTDFAKFDYAYAKDEANWRSYIVDAQGNKLTESIFQGSGEVQFVGGYAVVRNSEESKYGVINTKGEVVVPFLYDDTRNLYGLPYSDQYSSNSASVFNGYALLGKNDQYGFVNVETAQETTGFFADDDLDANGLSIAIEGEDDSVTIVACTGVQNTYTEEQYEDVMVLYNTAGRLYQVEKEVDNDTLYGVIDMEGNVLLPCEYTRIFKVSGSGNYLMLCTNDNVWQLHKITY